MPTPKEEAIDRASGLMFDVPNNTTGADIPDPVWDAAIEAAVEELAEYLPLKKRVEVTLAAETGEADLPPDFKAVDQRSFGMAVNPRQTGYSYVGNIYALQSIISAAADIYSSWRVDPPLYSVSFEFFDDGAGGKKLLATPAPVSDVKIAFTYSALHTVDDQVNSIPAGKRYLLHLKMCEHACRGMARALAGDRFLNLHYMKLAADFRAQFSERTRFRPVGSAG